MHPFALPGTTKKTTRSCRCDHLDYLHSTYTFNINTQPSMPERVQTRYVNSVTHLTRRLAQRRKVAYQNQGDYDSLRILLIYAGTRFRLFLGGFRGLTFNFSQVQAELYELDLCDDHFKFSGIFAIVRGHSGHCTHIYGLVLLLNTSLSCSSALFDHKLDEISPIPSTLAGTAASTFQPKCDIGFGIQMACRSSS
ncbi:hypothetical protein BJ165DRAFT_890743 [Panaeolus papilionaceus]|nr:hypothetical protein BJ165DRAFT_890743 [Panaeolus papilionaceus]